MAPLDRRAHPRAHLQLQPGVPGLYEGAEYCPRGKHRPTYDSKMRSLGRAFEQVNSEELTKRFYDWVSPIDDFTHQTVNDANGMADVFRVRVRVRSPIA